MSHGSTQTCRVRHRPLFYGTPRSTRIDFGCVGVAVGPGPRERSSAKHLPARCAARCSIKMASCVAQRGCAGGRPAACDTNRPALCNYGRHNHRHASAFQWRRTKAKTSHSFFNRDVRAPLSARARARSRHFGRFHTFILSGRNGALHSVRSGPGNTSGHIVRMLRVRARACFKRTRMQCNAGAHV